MKIILSASFSLISTLFVISAIDTVDQRGLTQHPQFETTSLTDCIESEGVANEIEITQRAMLIAARKVSGYAMHDAPESVEHCALKLV